MYKILLALQLGLLSLANAQNTKKITLADIWKNGTFSQKSVSGVNPMNDGKHYSSLWTDVQSNTNYILQYEYATGKVSDTILNVAQLKAAKKIELSSYSFSNDESQVMIPTDIEPVYRRSSLENNYIYNRLTKTLSPLSKGGKQKYAEFSPNGNQVAFVRDNNLFIKNLETSQEQQITKDGEKNKIINGGTDWVYEEEFEFARAFAWSPDGKKIAYYRFDESHVKEFSFPVYDSLYPVEYRYKYPKAGEENAFVEIYVYDLEKGKNVRINIGEEKNQYIPRIKWTNNPDVLCVLRMNRLQNKLEYLLSSSTTGESKTIITESSKTYIDVNDDLTFLKDGKTCIISTEKSGFRHLYLYDLNGKELSAITSGNWEVSAFYGCDEKNKTIYFQSTENGASERHVYSIQMDGSKKTLLTPEPGNNEAKFNRDFSCFLLYRSDANSPLKVSLMDKKGHLIRTLEENTKLRETLKGYELSKKEFMTISTSEGVELKAWIMKPADFDPTKKYPLFMFVYGGPGSQQVMNSWGGSNYMWYQLLTQKGYIVACVDNRGTGGRGKAFRDVTYLNLGKYETIDQIEAAKWFAKQTYIDASRIGIQGWSFGGYMSSLCIEKGSDIFKAAIAVAPVTSWRYYDSIYTERYLRTPKENESGYDENSPIHFTDKIKGNFLLIHGTADDNVHFQNSVDLVTALVKNNIPFQNAYYPNKNHGISGGNTRLHLYTLMTKFVETNL